VFHRYYDDDQERTPGPVERVVGGLARIPHLHRDRIQSGDGQTPASPFKCELECFRSHPGMLTRR